MNKKYTLFALMCIAAVSFTGCLEESFENNNPVKPAEIGDEIFFGARAGFESSNPSTRTVYGPEYTDEKSGKTFQRIDWIDGSDKVEIYSPQAKGLNPSCYVVMHDTDPDQTKDYAKLSRLDYMDVALQWGSDEDHDFYAMYPASETFVMNTDDVLKAGVKMTGTIVNGVVPHSQSHAGVMRTNDSGTPTEDGEHWVVKPDMNYAYMVARAKANRKDSGVKLSFHPIVTAVEIQLTFNKPEDSAGGDGSITTYADNLTITDVKVESEDIITGSFYTDLKDWTDTQQYPICEATPLHYENSARVSLWYDNTPENSDDSSVSAITVEDGGSITFTVFLLPGKENIDDLKVYFSTNGGSAWVGKDLPGVEIKKHVKNRILNLALPVSSSTTQVNVGNWLTQLIEQQPKTKLNRLSVPGTGGSFTFHSTSAGTSQQTLTIEQQWNMGIRAFEIVSNRPSTVGNSLGEQPIRCNGANMGDETVYSALKDLLDRVTAKGSDGKYLNSEFAVAILTYQPEGGYVRRRANAYAQSLVTMLTTKDNGTNNCLGDRVSDMVLYTSDLTIEQAKNKLILICRINQEGEPEPNEDYNDGSSADKNDLEQTALNYAAAEKLIEENDLKVLLVNGCGTAKDKWRRRGYFVNGTQARNLIGYGEDFNIATDVEPYLMQYDSNDSWLGTDMAWRDYSAITIDEDYINFEYSTNSDPCWYQEWARVSPGGENDFYVVVREDSWLSVNPDYRWPESYSEKFNHATMTFQRAIDGEFEGMVVINSLCGYFVDSSSNAYNQSYIPFGDNSYLGGTNGNIKALATELNRDFYQYVAASGLESKTGPTGIIMMDYVSNVPSTEGSYMLPGVIIANNFKF